LREIGMVPRIVLRGWLGAAIRFRRLLRRSWLAISVEPPLPGGQAGQEHSEGVCDTDFGSGQSERSHLRSDCMAAEDRNGT
jgi:hypothetical protein